MFLNLLYSQENRTPLFTYKRTKILYLKKDKVYKNTDIVRKKKRMEDVKWLLFISLRRARLLLLCLHAFFIMLNDSCRWPIPTTATGAD